MPSTGKEPYRFRSSRLWIAPAVGVAVATAAAAAALTIDYFLRWQVPPLPLFAGDADTVRTMLSVIVTAVTTLLALVFTIIAVVIQLASTQYSPRALRTLLKDRPSQFTIGVFVGTITYALILLLALRVPIGEDPDTAAGLAPTLAFLSAVLCIATFAVYSNHIAHSVRINSLIDRIAEETRTVIDYVYPHAFRDRDGESDSTPPPRRAAVLRSDRAGVLVGVDEGRLCELAREHDTAFWLVPRLGEYVPYGGPLLEFDADVSSLEDAHQFVTLAEERTLEQDPTWGMRILVDIAVRALSPGVNDPTTAAQVTDRLGDLLGRLARRDYPPPVRTDREGRARLFVPALTWEDLLRLGVDEIRLHGSDHPQVARRLRTALEFLLDISPEARRAAVHEQLRLLSAPVGDVLTRSEALAGPQGDRRAAGRERPRQ